MMNTVRNHMMKATAVTALKLLPLVATSVAMFASSAHAQLQYDRTSFLHGINSSPRV